MIPSFKERLFPYTVVKSKEAYELKRELVVRIRTKQNFIRQQRLCKKESRIERFLKSKHQINGSSMTDTPNAS